MNKDSALDYLIVAHTALQSNDRDKCLRLVRKAINLFPELNPRKEELLGSQCPLFSNFDNLDDLLQFVEKSTLHQSSSHKTRKEESKAREEEKNYTDQDVKEITELLEKQTDYYKVLRVEKNATNDDIKRAYRKMAMKFHPDRNQAPHASEAFKLVSAAYVTLSDVQKRRLYDQYGTDDQQTINMHRSPFGQRMNVNGHTFMFGQNDDDVFFDLFANMFGGIPQDVLEQRVHRMRRQESYHHQRRQHQQAPTNNGFGFLLLQVGVIMFIIFSSVFNYSSIGSKQTISNSLYSFHKTPYHPMQRVLNVNKDLSISYYVSQAVNMQMNNNNVAKRHVESQVYHEFGPYLRSKCEEEQQQGIEQQGAESSSNDEERWGKEMPHCELLHRFKTVVK